MKLSILPRWSRSAIGPAAGLLVWLAIEAVIGPKGVAYVGAHMFLTLFLPLIVIFFLLLVREMRRQYKR